MKTICDSLSFLDYWQLCKNENETQFTFIFENVEWDPKLKRDLNPLSLSWLVCASRKLIVFCCQFSIVIDQFKICAPRKWRCQGCCRAAQIGNLGTADQKMERDWRSVLDLSQRVWERKWIEDHFHFWTCARRAKMKLKRDLFSFLRISASREWVAKKYWQRASFPLSCEYA